MTVDQAERADIGLWEAVACALDLLADWYDLDPFAQPFRGECPACTEEVVVVRLAGDDVVLEVSEVLPTMRCSRCAANRSAGKLGSDPRSKPCWRCGGTGLVGGDVPSVGVAVAEDGSARLFAGGPVKGEGIHLLHRCLPPA